MSEILQAFFSATAAWFARQSKSSELMHMLISNHRVAVIFITIAVSAGAVEAKKKDSKPTADSPHDQIVIDAHLPFTSGPITRFFVTEHYNHPYIYAEREPGKPVTVIDATKPGQPVLLSEMTSGSLVAVSGTAALETGSTPAAQELRTQTIRIMDFSDPAHPKVTRQFDGVTAVERSGGLILLANPEGIWILSEHLAEDPAVDAEYAHRIVYQ
jgi:hypothetical protein